MNWLSDQAKAILAGPLAVVAYFAGIIPETGGFTDLTTVQWLGAILVLGGAYGITYAVPDSATPHRKRKPQAE